MKIPAGLGLKDLAILGRRGSHSLLPIVCLWESIDSPKIANEGNHSKKLYCNKSRNK